MSWTGNWVLSHACLQRPNSNTRWARVHHIQESDSPAPPGPWSKLVFDLDTESQQDHIDIDPSSQSTSEKQANTYLVSQSNTIKEPLSWHHFISCHGRIYKPIMTGREFQNVTCTFFTFPQPGTLCVMGRLVHTSLGSSYLIAHVLHCPQLKRVPLGHLGARG